MFVRDHPVSSAKPVQGMHAVDVDLQAVIVDQKGATISELSTAYEKAQPGVTKAR